MVCGINFFHDMALGGNQKGSLTKNMCPVTYIGDESDDRDSDDNEQKMELFSFSYLKKQDDIVNLTKKNSDEILCSKTDERKLNDFLDISEKNVDDINQSSDSLSSSASISDSDLTSTDSDDSLALSESESITDVTPLNSPYCDSPLPQNRHIEYKSEEKNLTNPCRNVDHESAADKCQRPEMNVLMKAIEKLEIEAKNNSEFGFRETIMRRRAASFSSEEAKRIEQENQRLFKRVISQQNRIRSIYSASNQPSSKNISFRSQDLVKSDGDISGTPKKSVKFPKQADKSQAHRRQKCLSHPSSYIYSCNHLIDKNLLQDGLPSEGSGKKKHHISPGVKITCPQKIGSNCEEVTANSIEMK